MRACEVKDAIIFHRRLSGLIYRLADQHPSESTGKPTESLCEKPTALTLLVSLIQLFCPMAAVSGVSMLSQLGDAALSGPGGAGLPAVSNTSVSSSPSPGANNRGCENGALMDSFGIFLQGLLAVMAFSTLMCEYIQTATVCQICDTSC